MRDDRWQHHRKREVRRSTAQVEELLAQWRSEEPQRSESGEDGNLLPRTPELDHFRCRTRRCRSKEHNHDLRLPSHVAQVVTAFRTAHRDRFHGWRGGNVLHERTVVQTAADAMFSTTARPWETAGAGTTASKSILRTMRKHSDPENLKIIS